MQYIFLNRDIAFQKISSLFVFEFFLEVLTVTLTLFYNFYKSIRTEVLCHI